MIDASYDYRWHQVLDPLAAVVKRWEADALDHVDLARAAGRVRKGVSPIDYVFSQKRAMLGVYAQTVLFAIIVTLTVSPHRVRACASARRSQ